MTQFKLDDLASSQKKNRSILSRLHSMATYIIVGISALILMHSFGITQKALDYLAGEIQFSNAALSPTICSQNPMGMIQSDCEALIDFYNNTNGDSWTVKTNWGSTWWDWYGISTGIVGLSPQVRVTNINFPTNNNIAWSLSWTIINRLTGLTQFIITNNTGLTWSAMPILSWLPNLQVLDLSYNQLVWNVPSDWTGLPSLQTLNLINNQLKWALPSSFSPNLTGGDSIYVNNAGLCWVFPVWLNWLIDDYNDLWVTNNLVHDQLCSAGLYCNSNADCQSDSCISNICQEVIANLKILNINKTVSGDIYNYTSWSTVYYKLTWENTWSSNITSGIIKDSFGTGLTFSWASITPSSIWTNELVWTGITFTGNSTWEILVWFVATGTMWTTIYNTGYMWYVSGSDQFYTWDNEFWYNSKYITMIDSTPTGFKPLNISKTVSGDDQVISWSTVYYKLTWENTWSSNITSGIIKDSFGTGLTFSWASITPSSIWTNELVWTGITFTGNSTWEILVWFVATGTMWTTIYNTGYMWYVSGSDQFYTWDNNDRYSSKSVNIKNPPSCTIDDQCWFTQGYLCIAATCQQVCTWVTVSPSNNHTGNKTISCLGLTGYGEQLSGIEMLYGREASSIPSTLSWITSRPTTSTRSVPHVLKHLGTHHYGCRVELSWHDRPAFCTTTYIAQSYDPPASTSGDLRILKSANPWSTASGNIVTYTLSYENRGNLCAGVYIQDILPNAWFEFGWATKDGIPVWNIVNNIWRYDIGGLMQWQSGTIIITGKVYWNTNDIIINTGVIASISAECASTGTATASINIQNPTNPTTPVADLYINKEIIKTGNPVVYKITYRNNGPNTASGVTITEAFPNNVFASTQSSPAMNNLNQWLLGDLMPWAQGIIILTGNITSTYNGTFTNTVTISSNTHDNNTANNTSSVQSTYQNNDLTYVDMGVLKTIHNKSIVKGSNFDWQIYYKNYGNKKATNVCIVDIIPNWLTYISNSKNYYTTNVWVQGIKICIGDVEAWTDGSFNLTTRWDNLGIFRNSVSITADTNTNNSNDSSSDTVTVINQTTTWTNTTTIDSNEINRLRSEIIDLKDKLNNMYTQYINWFSNGRYSPTQVIPQYYNTTNPRFVLPKTGADT